MVDALCLEGVDRMRAAELVRALVERVVRPRAPKPRSATAPDVQEVMTFYRQALEKRLGERPEVPYGEAWRIVTGLVKRHGAALVKQRLARFVWSVDEWDVKTGFALPRFVRQWNALALSRQPTQEMGCRHTPQCVDLAAHTRKMLAEGE